MRVAGIRELKNRLSEYLRQVRAGEIVLITDRGEVIAELGPPGLYPAELKRSPALAALVRERVIGPGLPNAADAYPALPRRVPEGTAARLMDEARGNR
jgi:antitoxin (DNA-binding transcriptional repressor) of toxin-antitoxin stability system